ncbi:hypothetical protein niasHT_012406 [Heterodera trifolii]|uniref:UBC core domain-containing protein n=1 Tax=Heterodera trifolii TaxID=157864 RepID=A0ABD2L992_9BILA
MPSGRSRLGSAAKGQHKKVARTNTERGGAIGSINKGTKVLTVKEATKQQMPMGNGNGNGILLPHKCRERPPPTSVFVRATFLCCPFAAEPRRLRPDGIRCANGTDRHQQIKRPQSKSQACSYGPVRSASAKLGLQQRIPCLIFKWYILINGPPETPYAGYQFRAVLEFPASFPHYPPTMTFHTDILHPNIFTSGKVCISILHPPGNDPFGIEHASERWNRNRSVESILVSVQQLMARPNFDSPANVDAAILFRNNEAQYWEEVRRRVQTSARPSQAPAQRQ